jgi:thiol-disulfide isomerase/thioredoxin
MHTGLPVVALSALLLSAPALAQLKVTEPDPPKDQPKTTTPAKVQPAPGKPADKPRTAGKLAVGDPAPAISADTWVKGDAVSSFETGKVYVMEFWATWCPPCRESIPHLGRLQKKYRDDLVIIGMASSERQPGQGQPDNRLDELKKFVQKQGAKMDYRVAYDGQRAMSRAWMEPAGQQFIPTAFVVSGEGKVVWISTIGGENERREMDKVVATEVRKARASQPADPAKPDDKQPAPR